MTKVYKFNSDKIDDIKEYDSITDIAKELHVSREHLSSIIHGKKHTSYTLAYCLSKYLGNKDVSYYFKEMEG